MADNQIEGHGDNIFVFIEHYYPEPGREEDVLKIATETSRMLHGRAGVIQVQVLRAQKKGPISAISVWESQEHFQRLLKSDEFKVLVQSDEMKNVQAWTTKVEIVQSDFVAGWHG